MHPNKVRVILRCLFSSLCLTLGLQGCGGCSSPGAALAVVTPTTAPVNAALLNLLIPAAVARCPAEGCGNGVLDASQITTTRSICNGASGSGVAWNAVTTATVQPRPSNGLFVPLSHRLNTGLFPSNCFFPL